MQVATAEKTDFTCREDLLETLPAVEVDEMRSAVASALEAAAGPGWRLIPVGGGARDIRSHDCDFVVTHDSNKCGDPAVSLPLTDSRLACMMPVYLGAAVLWAACRLLCTQGGNL